MPRGRRSRQRYRLTFSHIGRRSVAFRASRRRAGPSAPQDLRFNPLATGIGVFTAVTIPVVVFGYTRAAGPNTTVIAIGVIVGLLAGLIAGLWVDHRDGRSGAGRGSVALTALLLAAPAASAANGRVGPPGPAGGAVLARRDPAAGRVLRDRRSGDRIRRAGHRQPGIVGRVRRRRRGGHAARAPASGARRAADAGARLRRGRRSSCWSVRVHAGWHAAAASTQSRRGRGRSASARSQAPGRSQPGRPSAGWSACRAGCSAAIATERGVWVSQSRRRRALRARSPADRDRRAGRGARRDDAGREPERGRLGSLRTGTRRCPARRRRRGRGASSSPLARCSTPRVRLAR